jgi:hypothetical protein
MAVCEGMGSGSEKGYVTYFFLDSRKEAGDCPTTVDRKKTVIKNEYNFKCMTEIFIDV